MSKIAGKRVVITRPRDQASELENLLLAKGAVPLLYPCIDIALPEDIQPLDASLRVAVDGAFDWLILTSANTVRMLKSRLNDMQIAPGKLARMRVAAIGGETAKSAHELLGLEVSIIPEVYQSGMLAESLPIATGTRIWLPQSSIADSGLANALRHKGASVTTTQAYRTVLGSGGVDLSSLLAVGMVDVITFTSASTVTNFLQRLSNEGGDPALLAGLILACIGPKTAAVARQHYLKVSVMSSEHTIVGLVNALEIYYTQITTGESA